MAKAISPSKKEVLANLMIKLETALEDIKPHMGEKKFKRRIKKASKLFAPGSYKKLKQEKKIKAIA